MTNIYFINFLFQLFFTLFLHFLLLQRISKHQLNLSAIAGIKKKKFVNKIVAKVIVASLIQLDSDLKLMLYLLNHIADRYQNSILMQHFVKCLS
jgi:hypothetical protein